MKQSKVTDKDTSLPDALNAFCARFGQDASGEVSPAPTALDGPRPSVTTAHVRTVSLRVNPRKVTGPDGVPGRALRSCMDRLVEVFTAIFNLSLPHIKVPACFKKTTIIPVPKKAHAKCLNEYRPVALTSIVMKCFERLVMTHINSSLPACLNPLQLANRRNRSTVDAISRSLGSSLEHLVNKDTYIRLLLIDYSSTFSTGIPSRLTSKLRDLGLCSTVCNWILGFLTHRPQTVWIDNCTFSTITLNTGAPQGCVLSPLLYSLYTYNCVAKFRMNTICKFADDTII
eukprot:g34260.t1